MRGEVRRKIEMLSRALEFNKANPSTEPGHQSVVARLAEGVDRAQLLGMQQRTGTNEAQAATARRTQLRDQIEFGLLGPLVKVGRNAAKESPDLLGKFRSTRSHATHKAFLINARTMLAEAVTAKDLLVSQGMAATLPDDLAKALDKFEAEGIAINLSRRAHIGARAMLSELAGDLVDLVDVLDGFNRYRFQNDSEQLTVWTAAKSVVAHTPRKRGETPPPPASPDGTTRAA